MNKIENMLVLAALLLAAVCLSSCSEDEDYDFEQAEEESTDSDGTYSVTEYASLFAQSTLETYYLWVDEIGDDLSKLDYTTCKDPISTVEEIRYSENGEEVDRWTTLTDDMSSMTSSVQSLGLTYGFDFSLARVASYDGIYYAIVDYVSSDTPAEEAGLSRGDVIVSVDGSDITASNYSTLYNSASMELKVAKAVETEGYYYVDQANSRTVSLTALDMYEDPILLSKTFDVDGKKVGYLVYNSFDLNSIRNLPPVFSQFKTDGVTELILDLRYNTGGYVATEGVLASLIAPMSDVAAGSVYQTEVYNSILSAYWKRYSYDTNSYFSTTYKITDSDGELMSGDITDSKPDISKVYAIVTGSSASASEALLVGLAPYMDVTLVGSQTYGKYCSGYMLEPEDIFDTKYAAVQLLVEALDNWGIYVMVSKFADKDGNNAAIPDGIPADIDSEDNPLDGFQFGDENETMLKAALTAAGKVYSTTSSVRTSAPSMEQKHISRRPSVLLKKTVSL